MPELKPITRARAAARSAMARWLDCPTPRNRLDAEVKQELAARARQDAWMQQADGAQAPSREQPGASP